MKIILKNKKGTSKTHSNVILRQQEETRREIDGKRLVDQKSTKNAHYKRHQKWVVFEKVGVPILPDKSMSSWRKHHEPISEWVGNLEWVHGQIWMDLVEIVYHLGQNVRCVLSLKSIKWVYQIGICSHQFVKFACGIHCGISVPRGC